VIPKTVWKRTRHDAGKWGSRTIRELLDNVKFDYAKSPYAVADTLLTVVSDKPQAIILDFFAGSATTLHATAMLNLADGGARQCLLVTNNEVDDAPAKRLGERGIADGEPEFERHGVCETVTWPRVKACLSGRRPDGSLVPGEYLDGRRMSDGFEENAAYFKLDFLDPADVSHGDRFEAIVPILWMLAGCDGPCSLARGAAPWFMPERNPFAVLIKEHQFDVFQKKLRERDNISHVFLVTDSVESFEEMAGHLGEKYHCIQLYKSYLDTFKINLAEPAGVKEGNGAV
jgi:adenine-specific DNA-methyltransferase